MYAYYISKFNILFELYNYYNPSLALLNTGKWRSNITNDNVVRRNVCNDENVDYIFVLLFYN